MGVNEQLHCMNAPQPYVCGSVNYELMMIPVDTFVQFV